MSLVSEDLAVLRVRIWDRIDRRVLATLVVSAAAHIAFIAWARSAEAAHDSAPVVSFGDSDRFADPVVRLPPTALPAPLPTTTPASDPGTSKPGTATPSANPSHTGGPRTGPARVTDDGARTDRFLDLLGRRTLDGRGTLSPGDDRTVDIDRALDPNAKINRDGWDPSSSRGDDGTAISAGDRKVTIGGPGDVDTGDKGDEDLPVRKPRPGDQPDQPTVSAGGEDIARTIRKRYMAGFTRCYEHVFSPKNAGAGGRMEAEIEVNALGAVSDISISLPDALDDSAFENCLEQHIHSFRFGARSKPATVSFPFLFIATR